MIIIIIIKEKKKRELFFLREEFILVDFPATAFGGVASSFLPLIRNDHFS